MKHLKFRVIRRWGNGDKFISGSVGSGLGHITRLMKYWHRVGQVGTFIKPKRKPKPCKYPASTQQLAPA